MKGVSEWKTLVQVAGPRFTVIRNAPEISFERGLSFLLISRPFVTRLCPRAFLALGVILQATSGQSRSQKILKSIINHLDRRKYKKTLMHWWLSNVAIYQFAE